VTGWALLSGIAIETAEAVELITACGVYGVGLAVGWHIDAITNRRLALIEER
jgi:hypothetical protein